MRIELSSVTEAKRYLRGIGVSTEGIVVQRGPRNYAGPNCPGKAWNCTTARKVIQFSPQGGGDDDDDDDDDDDGGNRFVCSPAAAGTNAAANMCVVVQGPNNSTNSATCDIETRQPDGVITQTCHITQTGFRNRAFARLVALMSAEDTDQDVFQTISVRQTSGTGGNTLETIERALLRTGGGGDDDDDDDDDGDDDDDNGGGGSSSDPVTQDVHQIICGNQTASGNGPNVARSNQSQALTATKDEAATVNIAQNVETVLAVCSGPAVPFPTTFHPDTGDCAVDATSPAKESANACTRIHQTSVSGRNTMFVDQLNTQTADVEDTAGFVDIVQGNPSTGDPNQTGADGTLDQESTGLSQIFYEGDTRQTARVEDTGFSTFIDQTDVGPRCCAAGHQASHVGNDFFIDETLRQRAFIDGERVDPADFFDGLINQFAIVYGDCETTGMPSAGGGCIVEQSASNNVDSETNECGPATSCHEVVVCEAFGESESEVSIFQVGECFTDDEIID